MMLKVILAVIAVGTILGGVHADKHLKREAYSGEWESLKCEINVPYNTTSGISTGGYFKRHFVLNKNGSWSGVFSFFSDAYCKNKKYDYSTPKGLTFTVGGAAKNVQPAEEAEFEMGGGMGKEYDIVYLGTDDLLFFGARPVQGGYLTGGEFMRPVSLAPLLKRSGSNP